MRSTLPDSAPVPAGAGTGALLAIEGLTQRFGGVAALTDVSFSVDAHAVQALIGPNGAGKTTLFNAITGFLRPDGVRACAEHRPADDRAGRAERRSDRSRAPRARGADCRTEGRRNDRDGDRA